MAGDRGRGVAYRGRDSSSARRIVAAAVAVAVIVAAVVASVVFAVGISRQDRQTALRTEYSDFAKQVIVNLTSLDPDNTDEALKTLQNETSGRAQQQMQDSMKQATGLIRDQKITTKTTILSDAVTKAEPDEGSVIVVYGWEMTSPGQETTVQTFRWRVDLTRINGAVKMTNFEWVT